MPAVAYYCYCYMVQDLPEHPVGSQRGSWGTSVIVHRHKREKLLLHETLGGARVALHAPHSYTAWLIATPPPPHRPPITWAFCLHQAAA